MWQRQRRGLKPASFAVTPSDHVARIALGRPRRAHKRGRVSKHNFAEFKRLDGSRSSSYVGVFGPMRTYGATLSYLANDALFDVAEVIRDVNAASATSAR